MSPIEKKMARHLLKTPNRAIQIHDIDEISYEVGMSPWEGLAPFLSLLGKVVYSHDHNGRRILRDSDFSSPTLFYRVISDPIEIARAYLEIRNVAA